MESNVTYTREELRILWHMIQDIIWGRPTIASGYAKFLTDLEGFLRQHVFEWEYVYLDLKNSCMDLTVFHIPFEDLALGVNNLQEKERVVFNWRLRIGK